MSNQLSMDTVQAIHALRAQGWSRRKIARELGIHRSTVAAHLRSKPAKVPTGSEGSKPAKVPTGSRRRNPRRKTAQKVSKPNAPRIRKGVRKNFGNFSIFTKLYQRILTIG